MAMDIDQVALLARIKLREDEKKSLSQDLEKILDYVKKLNELDTSQTPPTSHALALENVFRPDAVNPQHVCDQALAHAPDREGNFFKVPKVIEGE